MNTRMSRGTVFGLAIMAGLAPGKAASGGPPSERRATLGPITVMPVTARGTPVRGGFDECGEVSTYSSFTFENPPQTPQVTIQAGFAENETAVASYTLPASAFPVRIRQVEMLFSTLATVQTTTAWTVRVWRGTPSQGGPIAEFSSDGELIPHIIMPPISGSGSPATLVQFQIDPQDPDQIVITDNGTHTFSVGFRIDEHNNQTQNACLIAPPQGSNAFPCTDFEVAPVVNVFGNWGCWIDCSQFLGCPGGCRTFAAWGTSCRPTNDWILRASWEPNSCTSGCYPDCNANQQLDVADFGCFQTKFVGGETYTDCNQDGSLTVTDFGCFQTKFVLGCP